MSFSRWKRRGKALVAWVLFAALYLILSWSVSLAELIAAGLSATFAVFLMVHLRSSFVSPLIVKPRWLLLLWRIPWAMLLESWLLLLALLRRLAGGEVEGVLLEHPDRGANEAEDPARRAFMTFGVCVTPNSYLVYEDKENHSFLVRQLVGKKLSTSDRLFLELP